MNITKPSVPVSTFPSVSIVCQLLSKEFNALPANQGGSIIGQATENVIDSATDDVSDKDWDTWIEYAYECSIYWAELNGLDC